MKYLDYSEFKIFLANFFSEPDKVKARLVGSDRAYDSGYFDIVRFFGPKQKIQSEDILIEYVPEFFKLADPKIESFAREIETEMRREGRLYDGPTVMKVAEYDPEENPYLMKVQEATYGDKAGSCFALDWPHHLFLKHRTLRNYYKSRYRSDKITENPLALSIGVCGYVLIEETGGRWLLQVTRSGKLTSLENTLGVSAAGGVDFREGYKNLKEMFEDSLSSEIKEELNLSPEEYSLTPLAYAREIFRGEKPQLFGLIESKLNREQLAERLNEYRQLSDEIARFEFIPLDANNQVEDSWFERLNHEARMNLKLLEEYLSL